MINMCFYSLFKEKLLCYFGMKNNEMIHFSKSQCQKLFRHKEYLYFFVRLFLNNSRFYIYFQNGNVTLNIYNKFKA